MKGSWIVNNPQIQQTACFHNLLFTACLTMRETLIPLGYAGEERREWNGLCYHIGFLHINLE